MKYHIRRTIGEIKLNFEEFSTMLAQIEACLNSRPICPINNDPNDLEILTPGHFLIGRAVAAIPEASYLERNENLLNRWQLVQKLSPQFWNKWQN